MFAIYIMPATWVNIPGKSEAKNNAAIASGGVALTVQTVVSWLKVTLTRTSMDSRTVTVRSIAGK